MNRVPFDQLVCLATKEDASPAQISAFKSNSLAMFGRNNGEKQKKLQRIENLEQSLLSLIHTQERLINFCRKIEHEHNALKKDHQTLEGEVDEVEKNQITDRNNMNRLRVGLKECMHEIEDLYKAHGGNYQPFPKNSSAHASDSDEDEE